ncbi:hypothetical protein [Erythrobacter sp.]|jgi:hypothetical protein|uniref:hypothetical protein n=1 Tax=Erythrobacter sp. TaxID=1042 RepID=UPI002EB94DA0|nr:hypothetical protein [Erythrobacter sp.]
MNRAFGTVVAMGIALAGCAGGSDVDQRFAEACENTPMLANSEPCRNPDSISDERKEQMIARMGELEQGLSEMQSSLDAAVEEARREAEAAQSQ